MRSSFVISAVLSSLALSPAAALAGADPGYLPGEEALPVVEDEAAEPDEDAGVWRLRLSLGASFALGSNSNVIGQVDGTTLTFGLSLGARADLRDGPHDWRNQLKVDEVFTRTPTIDELLKSTDELLLESTYFLRIHEVVGPFATFKLQTALFAGEDVREGQVDYVDADDPSLSLATSDRFGLTDPFQPLVMKQSIGVFARPIDDRPVSVVFKAGFGAAETFADGARAVADDGDTPEIELKRLTDFVQGGAVVGFDVNGEFEEGRIGYEARGEAMFPFLNDDPEGRSVIDLANYDFSAKVSVKVFAWMSLDYQFKVLRQPQLIDAWQVQNQLLLSFSYAIEGEG